MFPSLPCSLSELSKEYKTKGELVWDKVQYTTVGLHTVYTDAYVYNAL